MEKQKNNQTDVEVKKEEENAALSQAYIQKMLAK